MGFKQVEGVELVNLKNILQRGDFGSCLHAGRSGDTRGLAELCRIKPTGSVSATRGNSTYPARLRHAHNAGQKRGQLNRIALTTTTKHFFVRAEPKIGSNDPCPCGSGKKYKKCCLNYG